VAAGLVLEHLRVFLRRLVRPNRARAGRRDLAETFLKRSRSWRNVFDAETGFARPRKAGGEWVTPFDPFHTPGFVEGNAWQYTWFVPHDVPGLVEAMGRERFLSRLNEAFEKSAPTRFNAAGERFALFPVNHGNQPTMQVAWLFNWAGKPWLSQKWSAILDAYTVITRPMPTSRRRPGPIGLLVGGHRLFQTDGVAG
jgi:putative alpha-1,2-mannosidase